MDTRAGSIPGIGAGLQLLAMCLLVTCCATKEEPGIAGSPGQWLSNDTVAVRGVAVFEGGLLPGGEGNFRRLVVTVRNEGDNELHVRWARAEFRAKGMIANMTWSPVYTDSLPERYSVTGILQSRGITETDIAATESGLDFAPRTLRPQDTCVAVLVPPNPVNEPPLVIVRLKFVDGTVSRPFRIAVEKPTQDR